MDFSNHDLALVAYALVNGVDASLIESNGIVSSTKISTGITQLFLDPTLAQDFDGVRSKAMLSVTPGVSGGSLSFIARGVSAGFIASTAIQVVLASDTVGNTDFSILVLRTVLPPVTP